MLARIRGEYDFDAMSADEYLAWVVRGPELAEGIEVTHFDTEPNSDGVLHWQAVYEAEGVVVSDFVVDLGEKLEGVVCTWEVET